jgi:hypothetical protein
MKYALICFGLLPYLLLFMGPRMSPLYGIWLDVGWLFVVAGSIGLAAARARDKAAKAKADEAALREKIRAEITGERLLHSLN